MRERAGRDGPHELRGRADVLGERALVRERAAVHKARDVRPGAERRVDDACAAPHDDPGEVAPEHRSGLADREHDICVSEAVGLVSAGGGAGEDAYVSSQSDFG